jgi:hypothetical protein
MGYIEALTTADMEFGRTVWQELRRNRKFPASGVLWLFHPTSGEWRLTVATPRVDAVGPRRAYEELSKIMSRLQADSRQFSRIEVISPKVSFYQALRHVFGQTASVEGAQLNNTQVNGVYFDRAYLYEIR